MKKNHLILLVLILTLLSSCANKKKLFVSPKLTAIEVDIKKSKKSREITYTIKEDGNVTLPLDDARWITAKLNLCTKDRRKLKIANDGMTRQIQLVNRKR
ncbi:MAG: hypothetical protein QM493_02490 [Sulfurovum sp.]